MQVGTEYSTGVSYCLAIGVGDLLSCGKVNTFVQQSTINPKFLGLFASRSLKCDDIIDHYKGEVLRTAQALKLKDKSYLMRLGEQCYIDAKGSPFSLPRYINDCRNSELYNVKFVKEPENIRALVVAIRDIESGEELFVDYGKWYWIGSREKPIRLSSF